MKSSVIGVLGNAALEPRLWRAEDLEQRVLGNARYLWERFVRENRLALVGLSGVTLAMQKYWGSVITKFMLCHDLFSVVR